MRCPYLSSIKRRQARPYRRVRPYRRTSPYRRARPHQARRQDFRILKCVLMSRLGKRIVPFDRTRILGHPVVENVLNIW